MYIMLNRIPREPLNNLLFRHAGENQHPVSNCFNWILAFARMTTRSITFINQSFPSKGGCSVLGSPGDLIQNLGHTPSQFLQAEWFA